MLTNSTLASLFCPPGLASLDAAGVAAALAARGVESAAAAADDDDNEEEEAASGRGAEAAELEKLTVRDLKTRCRECGLPWHGVKADLVARLRVGPDAARAALAGEVRACNKKWVDEKLAREARKQLKDMGLEHTGKPWQVSARLEQAMWDGDGKAPTFALRASSSSSSSPPVAPSSAGGGPAAPPSTAGAQDDPLETAAKLAKALNVDVKLESTSLADGRLGISLGGGGGGPSAMGGDAEDELAILRSLSQEGSGRGKAAAQGAGGGASQRRFVDSTPKGLPKELTDVTTKYQAKLLAKTGGVVASRKVDVAKGDAEALNWGRAMLVQAAEEQAEQGPDGVKQRWLLGNGVGGLMEYLERRSMKTCLLPDRHTSFAELELFEQQLPSAIKGLVLVHPNEIAARFGGAGGDGSGGGHGAEARGGGGGTASASATPQKPNYGIFNFLFGGSSGGGGGQKRGGGGRNHRGELCR